MKRKLQISSLIFTLCFCTACTQILDFHRGFSTVINDPGAVDFDHAYYGLSGVITLYTEYNFNSKGRMKLNNGTYLTCVTPSPRNLKEGTRVRIGRFDKIQNAYVVTPI